MTTEYIDDICPDCSRVTRRRHEVAGSQCDYCFLDSLGEKVTVRDLANDSSMNPELIRLLAEYVTEQIAPHADADAFIQIRP